MFKKFLIGGLPLAGGVWAAKKLHEKWKESKQKDEDLKFYKEKYEARAKAKKAEIDNLIKKANTIQENFKDLFENDEFKIFFKETSNENGANSTPPFWIFIESPLIIMTPEMIAMRELQKLELKFQGFVDFYSQKENKATVESEAISLITDFLKEVQIFKGYFNRD